MKQGNLSDYELIVKMNNRSLFDFWLQNIYLFFFSTRIDRNRRCFIKFIPDNGKLSQNWSSI